MIISKEYERRIFKGNGKPWGPKNKLRTVKLIRIDPLTMTKENRGRENWRCGADVEDSLKKYDRANVLTIARFNQS